MSFVKNAIKEYDLLVEKITERRDYHIAENNEFQNKILVLESAIEQCPDIESLVADKLDGLRSASEYRGKFIDDAIEELDNIVAARRYFIGVMQKVCEHDWKFSYADHHKNEDFYRCDICGVEK